jgi:hypothetical protein
LQIPVVRQAYTSADIRYGPRCSGFSPRQLRSRKLSNAPTKESEECLPTLPRMHLCRRALQRFIAECDPTVHPQKSQSRSLKLRELHVGGSSGSRRAQG